MSDKHLGQRQLAGKPSLQTPMQWGETVPPRRDMLLTLGRWAGETEQIKTKPHQSFGFFGVYGAACFLVVFSMTENLSQIGHRSLRTTTEH